MAGRAKAPSTATDGSDPPNIQQWIKADQAVARRLFDGQPITIGSFELRSSAAIAIGKPTIKEWQAAFTFAAASEHASPYWVGDLLAYSETRTEWLANMDQAKAVTDFDHQTLINRASISRRVTGRARELSPSISHSAVIAALEPEEQEELLEQASAERWTVSELTKAKRNLHRRVRDQGGAATVHTVEVTVRLTREAATAYLAEEAAWAAIKSAIAGVPHAHVIGAKAWPTVGPLRIAKRKAATA